MSARPPRLLSPLRYWTMQLAFGVLLLVGGGIGVASAALVNTAIARDLRRVEVILAFVGFWLAWRAISPLVRSLKEDARLRSEWGPTAHARFAASNTPRQVFLLLLAVAEADGTAGPAERELVRRFLLDRFTDPIRSKDLATWEAERIATKDIAGLAHRVARGMSASERGTLFTWACLVAFVDREFAPEEHAALQQVAGGLGIAPQHAQVLFHLARELHLRQHEPRFRAGAAAGGAQHQQQQQQRSRQEQQRAATPRPAAAARQQALATLGLPEDADPATIRQRHRELVRRFHPDAQPNLGPVAQQEATERFRAIQRAYEILTT